MVILVSPNYPLITMSKSSNFFGQPIYGQLLTAVDWYRSDARMVPRWAVEWYHLGRTDSTAMIRADIEVPTPPAFFRPVVLSGLMIVMAVRKAFCR